MIPHLWTWVWGFVGVGGIAGLVALAIFGGPAFRLIVDVASAILTPIASVIGQGAAMLVKAEINGGIDMIATGQRILFVLTVCAIAWWGAQHVTWKKVHHGYWLTEKHYTIAKPRGHR